MSKYNCNCNGNGNGNGDGGQPAEAYKDVKEGRSAKTTVGCLGWLALSLAGGVMLSWWEVCFHPTNDQQWMVPLGLILFVTPIIVCVSLFISDFCNNPPTQQPIF